MVLPIILAVVEIFGLFTIGIFARLKGYINEKEIDRWSHMVLDLLFPAFIFSSIISGFKPEKLNELWPLPFLGFGLVLYGTIAGILLKFGLFSKNPDKRLTFIYICAVNNSAYLPIIIIKNIWGEDALANLFFFNLGTTLGIWTIGVSILGASTLKNIVKNLFTPNLFAALLALFFSVSGYTSSIPGVINRIITNAGSTAVPLMLVLIGASLCNKHALRISWPVIYITTIRLIIIPLSAIVILKMLPVTSDVFTITAVVSLMPAAVASVIMTRRFGGDSNYAASTALVSTVMAILTVPVAMSILF